MIVHSACSIEKEVQTIRSDKKVDGVNNVTIETEGIVMVDFDGTKTNIKMIQVPFSELGYGMK
jgi:hypothetical protein